MHSLSRPHNAGLPPCACTSLRMAARAVSRLYDEAMAASGVTTTQLAILRSLNRSGEAPLSRLAEAMVLDRTSLYRTIKPMIRSGWLVVRADVKGPAKLAALTPLGRAAMDAAAPFWEAAQARFIGALGQPAWEKLHAELGGLVATVDGVPVRSIR